MRTTACERSASSVEMPRCVSPRASRCVRTAAWVSTLPRKSITPALASRPKISNETSSSISVKPCSAERHEYVKPCSAERCDEAALFTGLHPAIEIDPDADILRVAHQCKIERLIGAADIVEDHAE